MKEDYIDVYVPELGNKAFVFYATQNSQKQEVVICYDQPSIEEELSMGGNFGAELSYRRMRRDIAAAELPPFRVHNKIFIQGFASSFIARAMRYHNLCKKSRYGKMYSPWPVMGELIKGVLLVFTPGVEDCIYELPPSYQNGLIMFLEPYPAVHVVYSQDQCLDVTEELGDSLRSHDRVNCFRDLKDSALPESSPYHTVVITGYAAAHLIAIAVRWQYMTMYSDELGVMRKG